jgi:threonine dehydrogenase-like Zn-dependent dehydrogenase
MDAAIFRGPRKIGVERVEVPEIADHEVLVAVEACGICGSDLHTYREGWRPELTLRQTAQGGIPGHELSGTIAAKGSAVEGFEIGDRICGVSFGGMAEYVPLPVTPFTLRKIPDAVGFDVAATVEPLANSIRIVRCAEPDVGANVVVFGMGIIGLGVIQAFKALRAQPGNLIAVDVSDRRLAMAREVGAQYVLNARECNPVERVREICGVADGYFGDSPAVDIVCDCVGHIKGMQGPPVLQQAVAMARPHVGRIVCFGLFEEDVTLDLNALVLNGLRIIGSLGFTPEDVSDAVEWLATGRIDRSALISHVYPLDRVAEAFEAQVKYDDAIKVLVKPSASSGA